MNKPTISRRSSAVVSFALALAIAASPAIAQDIWVYSPYAVTVWIALGDSPEFTERFEEQLKRRIHWQADIVDQAAWRVEARRAPNSLRQTMLAGLDRLEVPQDADPKHPMLRGDKVILISIVSTQTGYRIVARQFDCLLRAWGPWVERVTWQLQQIPWLTGSAIVECFVPLVRIEKVRGSVVQTQPRAGGLASGPTSPAWITDGSVLQPIIRRNDRLGNLAEDGIRIVQWTLLVLKQRQGTKLQCEIQSGIRSPISGRSSARIQKMALVSKPTTDATLLRLTSNDENPHPLAGYEIHSRTLASERSRFFGVTNWRGEILVRREEEEDASSADSSMVRMLYVISGTRMLARLPMIPGNQPVMTAPLPDDDPRLNAESVITGLKNTFMDLIAQRQLLATRIRSLVAEGEFDTAERLVEELRELDSRPEFATRLDQKEQQVAVADDRLQKRIDILFNDLRRLLGNHLDPQLPNQLANELAEARGKSGG